MGLVAITAATLRTRSASDAWDYAAAQMLAHSATEYGVELVRGNVTWRSAYLLSTENPCVALPSASGTMAWMLVDEDGKLADDDSDSVRIIGIGRVGRTRATESVRMLPTGQPLTCLGSSLHCSGDISLGSSLQFMTNQQVSSNGNISASGFFTSLQGNVEAVGTATGAINGNIVQNAAQRRMPGSSVFDYYLDNGTVIPISSIPSVSGISTIDRRVISTQLNPFGKSNPEGIYVIYCAGQQLCIKNSRIMGTLVLIDPAPNSSLEGSLRWDAAITNYPALLVKGGLVIKSSSTSLSEFFLVTNFNPASAPYMGLSDSDQIDTYPSEINGIVYLTDKLDAPQDFLESVFRGVTICGSINAMSSCRFNYRSLLFDKPPPGFSSGNPLAVVPGSRRRETLP